MTLKGFKSFADSTVLDFEPGVAVVVGPNGSGKSNVVDAIAWVLGAQAPASSRDICATIDESTNASFFLWPLINPTKRDFKAQQRGTHSK